MGETWTPRLTYDERDRRDKERAAEAERRRARQLEQAAYAELEKAEGELAGRAGRLVAARDYRALAVVNAELAALRQVLDSFDEEVRQSYRPPPDASDLGRQSDRERRGARARRLADEIERIERHELPALEAKLTAIPTPRELGAWEGDPDPRARHYRLINEQIAAKRETCARNRAEIARLDGGAAS
ncbi:MAG TPA: hypothetical protein VF546_13940 [Pyrinomonadaceae bacterium]|jgi:hypothetical protein